MRTCLFCGSTAKVTLEHALSKPILRHVAMSGPQIAETLRVEPGRDSVHRQWSTTVRNLWKRKAYCARCNNGWMQAMDEGVSPLIGPMINGHPTILSVEDKHALATWVTKMSLVFESLYGDRVVPDSVYRAFHASREPIGAESIHLARYEGPEHIFHARRVIRVPDATTGDVVRVEAVLMTIIIGQLITQTTLPAEHRELITVSHAGSDRVAIWPPSADNVTWPPEDITTFGHLPAFTSPLTK